jgi:hypothetical protein
VELALSIRQIWRHRLWLVPVAAVAVVAALLVLYHVSLIPPGLQSKSTKYGGATTQLLLQPKQPAALAGVTSSDVVSQAQASVYAALLQSQAVRSQIGDRAKLPWRAIAVGGHAGSEAEVGAAQRSAQLLAEGQTYSLVFSLEDDAPIITLYAQAPNSVTARRLVVGASRALTSYVGKLQDRNDAPAWQQVEVVQLGQPEAGNLARGVSFATGILLAFVVFGAGCLLIVLVPRMRLALRRASALEDFDSTPAPPSGALSQPALERNGSGSVPEALDSGAEESHRS